MSHFSVTVCLPADTDVEKVEQVLEDVMERWDENRDVEPYRSYEDGSPEDYWWVGSVRRGAKHHHAGTGVMPHSTDVFAGSDFSKHTEAEQRAKFADDAKWAELLGEHPTWADVVTQYNAKWHPGNDEELDTKRLHYDEETGRAYTWSQRNPDAMWDYWRVGGRWSGHFVARELTSEVLLPDSHWDGPKGLGRGFVDGGPKRLLDFDAMRQRAADEADARYDVWDAICAVTPPAHAWAYFVGLRDVGELTIEQARQQYHAQPRIVAVRANEELNWYDDVVEHFGMGREEYVANARRDEVPGYALITLDRQWMAPGRMGWFGMGTDEPGTVDAYKTDANAYLESLADDVFIVQLDCHI
jgi:hypothetical protein